jgi:hypothetical protein
MVSAQIGMPSIAIGARAIVGESEFRGNRSRWQSIVQEVLSIGDIAAVAVDAETAKYRLPCRGGMLWCNHVMQSLCMTAVIRENHI